MVIQKEFKNLSMIFPILILLVLSIIVVWPILQAILFGLLLTFIFNPLYKKILAFAKDKNLSAFIILVLILLVVGLPLWFAFPIIIKQAFNIYLYLQKIDLASIFNTILPSLVSTDTSQEIVLSLNKFISNTASNFFNSASSFLVNLPIFLLNITISLFVFFFSLRDQDKLAKNLKLASPFSPELENKLVKKFNEITRAVLYGFILIGILQGILTGVGLLIFKVPQPLFLTVVAIFAAMIPILGAWLVWIPASFFLILSGHTGAGIGLFLWGAIFVSWVDNLMRPYVISKQSNVSIILIFIGMMGGVITMGILGLILGPLILSYLFILLDHYRNQEK